MTFDSEEHKHKSADALNRSVHDIKSATVVAHVPVAMQED